jgi:plastocyanin
MIGEVVVEPATAIDLPTQDEIDAQAEAETAPLLEMAEATRIAATDPSLVKSEPGVNGSTIWYVPAGMTGADPRIEIYDFFPKDLTVKVGDTLIWTSTLFHQVVFAPGMPAPEFVILRMQDAGPPLMIVNPIVAFPAKPAGEYDGTQLFSSGLIGVPAGALPGGTTFALSFSKPGTYEYICGTHRPLGMKGTVTVVE